MRRCLLIHSIGLIALGGCAELSQRSESPTSRGPTTIAAGTIEIDRPTLQTTLLDLAEYATTEVDNSVSDVLATSPDAKVRAHVQSVRGQVAMSTTAIVTSGDPATALLDFITFLTLERWVTDRWLADRPAGAPEWQVLVALDRSLERARQATDEVLAPTTVARLDTLIATWKDEHPNADFVGNVRLADFAETVAPAVVSPVNQADRDFEANRVLGERFAFILRRLPVLTRCQAEESVASFLDQPEVERLGRSLNEGRVSIDRLASVIDDARSTAREIEETVAAIKPSDLAPVKDLTNDIRMTMADAKALLPDAQKTIVELKEAIGGAERVSASLKELIHGPDGKPIDLSTLGAASERFVTAAADLRAAIQQANALLSSDDATQRLAELTDTGKKGIDHVIWRIALLMVIGAALTMVLMVVRSLTRPRGEPPERQRRA